jgi:1-acyl-sn-glycerol-3-phosphate acyltransferase
VTRARSGRFVPVRRVARATAHLVSGLATIRRAFPRTGRKGRRRLIRRWSARLLALLGVERRTLGDATLLAQAGRLLVANHVSWLDIFVINATHPARFVAKSEIRRWPAIGALVAGVGTLFIERGRRRDTHRINEQLREALTAGELVALFPEGTTSDGSRVLAFHGSLLQAAIDAGGAVVPVAIRYRDAAGRRSSAAPYVGETTFLRSLLAIVAERRTIAEIEILPPLEAAGRTRRELAREAQALIRTALETAAGATAPETRPGRRAAAR